MRPCPLEQCLHNGLNLYMALTAFLEHLTVLCYSMPGRCRVASPSLNQKLRASRGLGNQLMLVHNLSSISTAMVTAIWVQAALLYLVLLHLH